MSESELKETAQRAAAPLGLHSPRSSAQRALIWMLLVGVVSGASAGSKSGASTATFLRLEQGARPVGMGGAFTALAEGAQALWWNPAGIVHSQTRDATLSHTQFIEDISSQFGSFVHPLPSKLGSAGYSFTYFQISGLEGFDASKNRTGSLKANAYAGSVAYGILLSSQTSFGVNVKYLGQTLADQSGYGLAVDLGLQYRLRGMGLGFAVQNLGPDFSIGSVSSPLPRIIRGGVFYRLLPDLVLAVDGESPTDGDSSFHVGGEWRMSGMLALRGGYRGLKGLGSSAGMTAGISFTKMIGWTAGGWGAGGFKSTLGPERGPEELEEAVRGGEGVLVSVDYAFLSYGDLSSTHRFTLGIRF